MEGFCEVNDPGSIAVWSQFLSQTYIHRRENDIFFAKKKMKNDVYFMYKVLDIEAVFLTDTDIWNFFYNLHIFLLRKDLFVVILYKPAYPV